VGIILGVAMLIAALGVAAVVMIVSVMQYMLGALIPIFFVFNASAKHRGLARKTLSFFLVLMCVPPLCMFFLGMVFNMLASASTDLLSSSEGPDLGTGLWRLLMAALAMWGAILMPWAMLKTAKEWVNQSLSKMNEGASSAAPVGAQSSQGMSKENAVALAGAAMGAPSAGAGQAAGGGAMAGAGAASGAETAAQAGKGGGGGGSGGGSSQSPGGGNATDVGAAGAAKRSAGVAAKEVGRDVWQTSQTISQHIEPDGGA
jgi:type IV secretory pathway VirB6-like protein